MIFMVWDQSVNVKSLSFQASFFLPVMFYDPGIKRWQKSVWLDWGFPLSLMKGVKVIWRWPCKSYFPLNWLFPMPSVALPSLSLPSLSNSSLFFPLGSRDFFSWPHFCISLAILMQMSAITDASRFINMLKNFLPSFLVTLERQKMRNS